MNNRWTRDEVILALLAYCQVPFNKASNSHPWVVRIANAIKRTPAAVKMKIGNFGAFDPSLKERGIVGLSGYSKTDEAVWNEFYGKWDTLLDEALILLKKYESNSVNDLDLQTHFPKGKEIITLSKSRVNQLFFRNTVLSSYNNQCCVSGISSPLLLEASHIMPWSENEAARTDPSNGLCLNSLLHQAYDNFLFSITPSYTIDISCQFLESVNNPHLREFLISKQGSPIMLPDKFLPNRDYLNEHYLRYQAISV